MKPGPQEAGRAGRRAAAERLVAAAAELGLPDGRDPAFLELAELLVAGEVGDEVPAEVLEVVARLVAHLLLES